MPGVIVVGAQWGDEGKGKIVDNFAEYADIVVRFQGGNNAGHTVIVGDKKTALKLLPSGILREKTRCLLASGVVVDPFFLIEEMELLRSSGVSVSPENLGLAGELQLVLPYHSIIDRAREERRSKMKIGTTGRGIGPAYEDSSSRRGIRLIDLFHFDYLESKLKKNVVEKNLYLEHVLGSDERIDEGKLLSDLKGLSEILQPYLANVSKEVDEALSSKKTVLFEGAQGTFLDASHGTYPFVTSSNTISGAACVSTGVGPTKINRVLGICKAYTTRVGSGPFPTEDDGEEGKGLQERGGEFGTVTGRVRRCGWFDAVLVNRAVRLNGMTDILLTKLDVLSGVEKIKIANSYLISGDEINDTPVSHLNMEKIEVNYEELPGWSEDISAVRSFDDLPENAKKYITRIEELVSCRVSAISVGPEREQMILREGEVADLLCL